MTQRQTKHLENLMMAQNALMGKKFVNGTVEHPGDLQDMPLVNLLENAINECVDQFTYLQTALEKAKKISQARHTPGRIVGHGEMDVECFLCWNMHGNPKCQSPKIAA